MRDTMPSWAAIEAAKKLGLNTYEARAYTALAESGVSTASEISASASIPRARAYDVLEALAKKGFVAVRPGRPAGYGAVPIAGAVRSIEAQKRSALEAELAELASMKGTLERTLKPATGKTSGEGAWLITGRGRIYEKIGEHIAKSKSAVLISATKRGTERKRLAFAGKLASAKKRGVKASWAESRAARFLVFDRSAVMLFLGSEQASEGSEKALLIESPQLAGFFAGSVRK